MHHHATEVRLSFVGRVAQKTKVKLEVALRQLRMTKRLLALEEAAMEDHIRRWGSGFPPKPRQVQGFPPNPACSPAKPVQGCCSASELHPLVLAAV